MTDVGMIDGSSLGYNEILVPEDPNTPRPDYLWVYTNHDPLFYFGALALNGFIPQAWRALPLPAQIKPFIPPRLRPPYAGASPNSGSFASTLAPVF